MVLSTSDICKDLNSAPKLITYEESPKFTRKTNIIFVW